MIPAAFEYYAPGSVAEAISMLQQHGEDAKLLAGGHSLLPAMKLRLAQPSALIDISRVAELKGISANNGLSLGGGVTYTEIEHSEDARKHSLIWKETMAQLGDIQVRNRGTIGGSLAHADPAADLTAVVLALGAQIHAQGPAGNRTIAADDMFVSIFTTALAPDEIITRVTFAAMGAGEGAAYQKMRHPASRYAIVGVAAYVKLNGGSVSSARIAVTGAGPMAVRQPGAEVALIGTDGGEAAVAAAAAAAGEEMEFLGDIHASEEYRKAMVKVYTGRAVQVALARARG